jgi:hypothetical protein
MTLKVSLIPTRRNIDSPIALNVILSAGWYQIAAVIFGRGLS